MSGSAVLKKRPAFRRITVGVVQEAMREVVQANPARADRRPVNGLRPRYVEKGEPTCLVAMILAKLGYSTGVLKALDQEHPVGELCAAGVRVQESRHPALRKIDPLARMLLQYVQDKQDSGYRWDQIMRAAFSTGPFGLDRRRKPWLRHPAA